MAPLFAARHGLLPAIFLTPLFFGVAHLHHLHDLITYQGVAAAQATMVVSFVCLSVLLVSCTQTAQSFHTSHITHHNNTNPHRCCSSCCTPPCLAGMSRGCSCAPRACGVRWSFTRFATAWACRSSRSWCVCLWWREGRVRVLLLCTAD